MRGSWLVVTLSLAALPAWSDATPAEILASALAGPTAEERLDALVALVELGRLEPVRARASELLADPAARVRAEALVALAGNAPTPELRAVAERWLLEHAPVATQRAQVDDARFMLAALLAPLDPGCAATAAALEPAFPRAVTALDAWLTDGDELLYLASPYPPAALPGLRRAAVAWLDGAASPACATIGRALIAARDPEVAAAVLARFDKLTPAMRVSLGGQLIELGLAGPQSDDLRKRIQADGDVITRTARTGTEVLAAIEGQLAAGVPGAAEKLVELAKLGRYDAAGDVWLRRVAPWETLEQSWEKARANRNLAAPYAVGMLRANAAAAVPVLLAELEQRFRWSIWRALETATAAISEADRERLHACLIAASGQPGFHQPDDLPPSRHYRSYEDAHRHGVPGMVERLAARYVDPAFAKAEVAGCLYRMGATELARAMARNVLARDGARWLGDSIVSRLTLATALVSHDPALARETLIPVLGGADAPRASYLVAEGTADEGSQILHAAAAVVLAAAGEPGAARLVEDLQRGCLGWRRFRVLGWRPPADLLGFVAAALTAAQARFKDDLPKQRRAGYRTPPTLDGERAWLLATLALRGVAADDTRTTLTEILRTVDDPEARRLAVRALGRVATAVERSALEALACEGVVQAERDAALWIAGDAASRPRLAKLLETPGPGRVAAARALLERP